MRPISFAAVLQSACLFGTTALRSGAQGAAAESPRQVELRGTVVDGQTSQPLARALVATGDRRLAALTDKEGRFSILVESTAAASGETFAGQGLSLYATKPGYFPRAQPAAVILPPLATTSEEIQLTLMPAASLSGEITGPAIGTSEHLQVILLRHQIDNGLFHWVTAGFASNGQESFHFGALEPAEYTVEATVQGSREYFAPDPLQPIEDITPTFAGDTGDVATASHFLLHYGETAHTNIHLASKKLVPVTLRISAPAGTGYVDARVLSPLLPESHPLTFNEKRSTVRGWLPKGSYQLLLSGSGASQSFAEVAFQVGDAPQTLGPVELAPSSAITVHLHNEMGVASEGSTSPAILNLSLVPLLAGGNAASVGGPEKEALILHDVAPGSYTVAATGSPGYVATMRSGNVDLLREPLVIDAGRSTPPIEVVLRDDFGSLTGTVAHGNGPLPRSCHVVAIDIDAPVEPRSVEAEANGDFEAENLPPGSYLIFAVAQAPERMPYRDPRWLEQLGGKAAHITVPAKGAVQGTIPLLQPTDLEAQL